MKITFYDIFRYLRSVLDGEFQTELTMFIAAFVLQRLQSYVSRFPEAMSFSFELDSSVVDMFGVAYFVKAYLDQKCGKFAPDSLMLSIQFINAFLLSQFGDNVQEIPSV